MIAKQFNHINNEVITFSSLWEVCPSKTEKMKEAKSLLAGVALFLFTFPLHAQKVYVCRDTICHVIEMHDDESILYQEEDERIAFGLNMVYDTNEVDSVTFDKPSQLKSMEMGWMDKSWDTTQRFVVPPLRELEMMASEFQVRSDNGFGTDNVNYVARFKSKTAAKKFADKYKKAESDRKFTLRTLGRNRHVPAYMGMKNENERPLSSYTDGEIRLLDEGKTHWLRRANSSSFGAKRPFFIVHLSEATVLSFSDDSCEVTISYHELFKNVPLKDARRVLFYWQNYQVDSADPLEQLLPETPVFGMVSHTNDGVVYEVHSDEMDVTCKAWLVNNDNENDNDDRIPVGDYSLYSGIRFELEFGDSSIADSLYACWKEKLDESVSLELNGNSISLKIAFSEPLPLEKAMVQIIRFDLEWHRPPLWDDALKENNETEDVVSDVDIQLPLYISNLPIVAFIHDHSDIIEENTWASYNGALWSFQHYLTEEDKIELRRLGTLQYMISDGDTSYYYVFDEKLPSDVAESLWSRIKADKEIQVTVESSTFDLLNNIGDPSLNSKYEGINLYQSEYIQPSTCTLYEQVNTDASFGIPYNSYLSLRPKQSDDNQIDACIYLNTVLLPLPYEVELVFAPDVVEHTDTLPSIVNISLGYHDVGDMDVISITEKSEMVNPQDGSKNFVIANNGECVSVNFDWTPDYMLHPIFLKVNSNVSSMQQGKFQKDFRLSKISLKLKDTN